MSIQKIVSGSLISAFVLGIAGLAAARQPPALVRAQAATQYAVACEGARADTGAGYRDAVARNSVRGSAPQTALAKAGPGYRDAFARRTRVEIFQVQLACVNPPKLTASR